jgi:hypothetical protein
MSRRPDFPRAPSALQNLRERRGLPLAMID